MIRFFFPDDRLPSRVTDSRRVSLKIDPRSKCWMRSEQNGRQFLHRILGIKQIPAASIIDAPIVHRSNFTILVITRVEPTDATVSPKSLLSRSPNPRTAVVPSRGTNSWIRERLIGRELKVSRCQRRYYVATEENAFFLHKSIGTLVFRRDRKRMTYAFSRLRKQRNGRDISKIGRDIY